MEAHLIVGALGLQPHPEGGWYAETWRHEPADGSRGAGSAIYFLLRRGERSHWHRVDADEIWHFYAGAPLRLRIMDDEAGRIREVLLGPDIASGERPQALVPAGAWQTAVSLGDYTLVGATVSPAFQFEGFELAPQGWTPDAREQH